ncbi:hypothetical protein GQ457_03G027240 [Hibiscus cannabinus]
MARFEEDRSISCPPLFEGEAYSQWSNVKKYFIQAQDFELWDIIEEGYIEAPKKKKKQMSENDTKAKLNSRAMHILLCGLNEEVSKKGELHAHKDEHLKKEGFTSYLGSSGVKFIFIKSVTLGTDTQDPVPVP